MVAELPVKRGDSICATWQSNIVPVVVAVVLSVLSEKIKRNSNTARVASILKCCLVFYCFLFIDFMFL